MRRFWLVVGILAVLAWGQSALYTVDQTEFGYVTRFGDPTAGLGYGAIDRGDGLASPADAAQIARRRLLPLVERMRGDHGFEVGP